MNYANCNGSPQQIPLQQLPFANEAKPRFRCRSFWAFNCRIKSSIQLHLGISQILWQNATNVESNNFFNISSFRNCEHKISFYAILRIYTQKLGPKRIFVYVGEFQDSDVKRNALQKLEHCSEFALCQAVASLEEVLGV